MSPPGWSRWRIRSTGPSRLSGCRSGRCSASACRGAGATLLMVVLLGLAGGALGLVTPVATGMLFNSIIPAAERDQLLQITLILLACALATGMFELVRRLALTRVDGRMGAAMQAAVWDRLLSLPLGFFRPYSAGDLAVRAMGIDAMRKTLSGATVTAALGACSRCRTSACCSTTVARSRGGRRCSSRWRRASRCWWGTANCGCSAGSCRYGRRRPASCCSCSPESRRSAWRPRKGTRSCSGPVSSAGSGACSSGREPSGTGWGCSMPCFRRCPSS